MFVDMTEPLITDLKKTYENEDWPQLSEIGHSLKGSARSVGAIMLGDLCGQIQDEIIDMDHSERKNLIEQTLDAFKAVKDQITEIDKNKSFVF